MSGHTICNLTQSCAHAYQRVKKLTARGIRSSTLHKLAAELMRSQASLYGIHEVSGSIPLGSTNSGVTPRLCIVILSERQVTALDF